MTRRLVAALIAFSWLLVAPPLTAHHSTAMYDTQNPVTITGAVKRFEWTNPHAFVYLDVKDEKTGKVTNYGWEMGSPNGLMRRGWTRNSLKVGQVVTVEGSMAKDGSNNANASTVTIDGKKLFAGSSGDPAN